jgi:hypothetical protein
MGSVAARFLMACARNNTVGRIEIEKIAMTLGELFLRAQRSFETHMSEPEGRPPS